MNTAMETIIRRVYVPGNSQQSREYVMRERTKCKGLKDYMQQRV